ncbi:MAG: Zn-dependent hydrolase [Gemmatimonadota bacterium]
MGPPKVHERPEATTDRSISGPRDRDLTFPGPSTHSPAKPPLDAPATTPQSVSMDRRAFSRLSATALAGLALPSPMAGLYHGRRRDLRVSGARLNGWLTEMSRFGANAAGGVDRVAYSDADLEGRAFISGLMREAGLDVSVDLVGNIWGQRAGSDATLPPLVLGSHTDSVPNGGNFDGPLGSLGAVEAAWTLEEAGVTTRHPLSFVVFSNEEGGKTGSRALIGEVSPTELDLPTASGYTIAEGIRRIGGDPARLAEVRLQPGSISGFLELHIEQGATLDRAGEDIGVVLGIVGIMRWNVEVVGAANHAGTTPMRQRRDAMVAAARFTDMVYTTVTDWQGNQVATVGRVHVEPNAPNVIPGKVTLSLEIRDLSMDTITEIQRELEGRAVIIGEETGTTFTSHRFYTSDAAPTSPSIQDMVEESARDLGLTTWRMPSGAGHDAQSMAKLGPMGMIFVPSVGGISHAPDEFTAPEDNTNGADVLLRSLMALDRG